MSSPLRGLTRTALNPATAAGALTVVLLVIYAILQTGVMTWSGLGGVTNEGGTIAIAAVGETLIVLAGGFDLSVGSVISVVNVLIASRNVTTTGSEIGIIALALLVGTAIGAANGLVVTLLRIPSIVATLAMSFFWSGVALLILSAPGGIVSIDITNWMTGTLAGPIPSAFFVLAFVALVWLGIKHSRFGYALYAVGGDESAAAANGVRVRSTTVAAYAAAGFFYGLAGIFLSGQSGSGDPTIGAPLLLSVFAAVVVGGTLFGGGKGGAIGSIFGALILTLIAHVLYAIGVSSFYTDVLNGSVLLVAVIGSTLLESGMGREWLVALRREWKMLRAPREGEFA